MGNKQSAPKPPPPPKCSGEKAQADYWSKVLKDTTNVYNQKKLASERCSPEQAAARAVMGSGPSECQVNDVKLGMAQKDAAVLDKKWEQCYPDQAIQRRLRIMREEAAKYTRTTNAAKVSATNDFNTKVIAVGKLSTSARELYKNLYEKERQLSEIVGSRQNNEQLERRERRAFLDNDPQGGTGGVPGIRTADDRSLFAFWITYGAAIIAVSLVLLNVYGAQMGIVDIKSKGALLVIIGALAYSIAYYFISYYG
jgi:hypothetical protein